MPDADPPKRRGRPRLSVDEKKQHTLTFRMRGDLRDAVEELANIDNTTVSEKVEHLVDYAVRSEAAAFVLAEQATPPALAFYLEWNSQGPAKNNQVNSRRLDRQSRARLLADQVPPRSPEPSNEDEILPWVKEAGGHEKAVDMARALLDGTVRGALDSFEAMMGPAVVAAVQADGVVGLSSINIKTNRTFKAMEKRCAAAEADAARLRTEIDALWNVSSREAIEAQLARLLLATSVRKGRGGAEGETPDPVLTQWLRAMRAAPEVVPKAAMPTVKPPRMPLIADLPPESLAKAGLPEPQDGDAAFASLMDRLNDITASMDAEKSLIKMRRGGPGNEDYSIGSLIGFLGRFMDRSPDLKPLWDAKWPYRFADLPAETRAALIGALQVDAPGLYEALVFPLRHGEKSEPRYRPSGYDLMRGAAMGALRRMQHAFLPAEATEVREAEGRLSDGSDEVGAAARRRRR